MPAFLVSTLSPIFLPLLSLLDEDGGLPSEFGLRDFVVGMGVDWGEAMSGDGGFCCSIWFLRSCARRTFSLVGRRLCVIVASVVMEEEEEEGVGAMARHVQLRTTFGSLVEACVTSLSRLEMKF